jgi:RecJ-like exonuclease
MVVEVPLERVLDGGPEPIRLTRLAQCTSCGGSGAKASTKPRNCDKCQGSGKEVCRQGRGGAVVQQISPCPACHGRGIIDNPCPDCAGRGQAERSESLSITVIRVLALRQPWAVDLREVLSALRIAIELERICDHAEDLAERVITLRAARVEPVHSLVNLGRFAMKMVNDAMHAYRQRDANEAQQVWTRDAELDAMYTALFRELLR